jgi:hypothetical protein
MTTYKTKEKPNKDDLLKTLKRITEIYPNVVIGGSISFISRGLLDREPNDIDILIGIHDSISKIFLETFKVSDVGSDTVTDINGDEIQRTSIKIDGVNVCVFRVKDNYLEFDNKLYEGIPIKSQKPYYGIEAKKVYVKKGYNKHNDDLIKMNEKL